MAGKAAVAAIASKPTVLPPSVSVPSCAQLPSSSSSNAVKGQSSSCSPRTLTASAGTSLATETKAITTLSESCNCQWTLTAAPDQNPVPQRRHCAVISPTGSRISSTVARPLLSLACFSGSSASLRATKSAAAVKVLPVSTQPWSFPVSANNSAILAHCTSPQQQTRAPLVTSCSLTAIASISLTGTEPKLITTLATECHAVTVYSPVRPACANSTTTTTKPSCSLPSRTSTGMSTFALLMMPCSRLPYACTATVIMPEYIPPYYKPSADVSATMPTAMRLTGFIPPVNYELTLTALWTSVPCQPLTLYVAQPAQPIFANPRDSGAPVHVRLIMPHSIVAPVTSIIQCCPNAGNMPSIILT